MSQVQHSCRTYNGSLLGSYACCCYCLVVCVFVCRMDHGKLTARLIAPSWFVWWALIRTGPDGIMVPEWGYIQWCRNDTDTSGPVAGRSIWPPMETGTSCNWSRSWRWDAEVLARKLARWKSRVHWLCLQSCWSFLCRLQVVTLQKRTAVLRFNRSIGTFTRLFALPKDGLFMSFGRQKGR